jgi:Ca2+-binding EF-hand superfamily protein
MQRLLLATVTLAALMAGSLLAAEEKDKKDKDSAKPTAATVTKVDAKKGEITVKFTDPQGKEAEKTFHLTKDIHIFDETGRAAAIDVFESGHDVLIFEAEGNLKELRRAPSSYRPNSLSSQVRTLIEMCAYDPAGVEDLQRIYDELRKLDTGKDGKIDAKALKAASDRIAEERVDAAIKRLDVNKDGKISREEAKGLIKENFDKIDTNKDGFIDREELLRAAKERIEAKTPQPEKK